MLQYAIDSQANEPLSLEGANVLQCPLNGYCEEKIMFNVRERDKNDGHEKNKCLTLTGRHLYTTLRNGAVESVTETKSSAS